MTNSTDIALTRPDPTFTMDVLRAQMEAAKRYVDSGLLPAGINTPQKALTIMQAGREIGVPPTYALRNIHVIEGKPTVSAELLMALVRRTYGQAAIRVKDATSLECTVQYREQGWDGTSTLTFTIADAEAAGLASRPMWKKYPRAMLRSRAVSEAVRMAFPECIAGLYTPEEMGADVRMTSDGSLEIVDVEADTPDEREVSGVVINEEPTPPRRDRVKMEQKYHSGLKAAAELGIEIDGRDPKSMTDDELRDWLDYLAESVNTVVAQRASQAAELPV